MLNMCWLLYGGLLQIAHTPDDRAGLEPGSSNSKRPVLTNIIYCFSRSGKKTRKNTFFQEKSRPLAFILGLYCMSNIFTQMFLVSHLSGVGTVLTFGHAKI